MDWEELFPGRFLKAADLKGDTTLTIAKVEKEKLPEDDNKKKVRGLVTFRESRLPTGEEMKQLVLNRTNATAIKGMFGAETNGWHGKRITLFPVTVDAFGEQASAIRVKGSPDLREAIQFEARVGRKERKFKLVPTGQQQRPTNGNTGRSYQQRVAQQQNGPAAREEPPDDWQPDPSEPPLLSPEPNAT